MAKGLVEARLWIASQIPLDIYSFKFHYKKAQTYQHIAVPAPGRFIKSVALSRRSFYFDIGQSKHVSRQHPPAYILGLLVMLLFSAQPKTRLLRRLPPPQNVSPLKNYFVR